MSAWLDRLRDVVVPLESAVPVICDDLKTRCVVQRMTGSCVYAEMIDGNPGWYDARTFRLDLDHPQGVAYALRLIVSRRLDLNGAADERFWLDLLHDWAAGRLFTDVDRLAIADALAALFGGGR